MENKINLMGSEVEKGYKCKPKKLDPNKPIMYYKALIYVCTDARCSKKGSKDQASFLREIVKECGLQSGKNRIKISRSFCQGACRFGQVAQVNSDFPNNKLWLKKIQDFSKEDFLTLFDALIEDKEFTKNKIPMKIY